MIGRWIGAALLLVFIAHPATGRAGDKTAVVLSGTAVDPMGEEGRVAPSAGLGGDIFLVPDEFLIVGFGGFGAIAQQRGKRAERDLYDVHFMAGVRAGDELGIAQPYATLGLNGLSVTTRDGAETYRGTTVGLSAQLGVAGLVAENWLYRVSATFVGAVVPGTGDDLGGVVWQLGVGRAFDM